MLCIYTDDNIVLFTVGNSSNCVSPQQLKIRFSSGLSLEVRFIVDPSSPVDNNNLSGMYISAVVQLSSDNYYSVIR